jgi:hypothetical protein
VAVDHQLPVLEGLAQAVKAVTAVQLVLRLPGPVVAAVGETPRVATDRVLLAVPVALVLPHLFREHLSLMPVAVGAVLTPATVEPVERAAPVAVAVAQPRWLVPQEQPTLEAVAVAVATTAAPAFHRMAATAVRVS